MRKLFLTVIVLALTAASALGQGQSAPTLTVKTEDPNLPSELFYGNTRVKPLRLRPGTNTPITINDADFFVQQQYVDFLSRFPDQSGFNFWVGQISSCAGDAKCIDVKRQNVSGAFFLSGEYQETGFFAIRIQRVAFGKRSNQAATRMTYQQLTRDQRQIGAGVIIGQPGAENLLESNKQAYASQVAGSAEFAARFPQTSGDALVDALYASAGVTPTATERQEAIAAYGAGGATGRAAALKKVAESGSVHNAEKSPAFVLLQYHGYLRRNPTDFP
ncbi:MAG TPA: hypothetical protein VNA19_07485, partial [Pyrinomonadaceae bacterium]|nr:hypothetical protein [Pyrinomonadaceae bacterium]